MRAQCEPVHNPEDALAATRAPYVASIRTDLRRVERRSGSDSCTQQGARRRALVSVREGSLPIQSEEGKNLVSGCLDEPPAKIIFCSRWVGAWQASQENSKVGVRFFFGTLLGSVGMKKCKTRNGRNCKPFSTRR